MTVLNGHFDGRGIVIDDPLPSGLSPSTPVKILIDDLGACKSAHELFERIAEQAVEDDGLPADYAEQHDHYVRGTPRR